MVATCGTLCSLWQMLMSVKEMSQDRVVPMPAALIPPAFTHVAVTVVTWWVLEGARVCQHLCVYEKYRQRECAECQITTEGRVFSVINCTLLLIRSTNMMHVYFWVSRRRWVCSGRSDGLTGLSGGCRVLKHPWLLHMFLSSWVCDGT